MATFCRNFLICVVLTLPTEISTLPATSKSAADKRERPSSLFALDIESCACKPASRDCEVAIASSVFSEIMCPQDQHFCCSVAKKKENEAEVAKTVNSTKPEVKVKIVSTEDAAKPPIAEALNMTTKIETRCRCKLRDKCSEKNTDYSFGFHCSYDKVRCCEPVDNIDSEGGKSNIGLGERVINVFTDPESEKLNKRCKCLPHSQCNVSPHQVAKGKDTACPDNLIQCCGEAIAEKKSDDADSIMIEPEISTRLFTPTTSVASNTHNNDNENGRSPLHQPVPIPLVKIPSAREPQVDIMSMTTTMPPPNLPIQYFVSPASSFSYNRYYLPSPQKPTVPSQYLNPSRPYAYRVGNRYAINQNGRGLAESERSSGSSFLSNLASMLG